MKKNHKRVHRREWIKSYGKTILVLVILSAVLRLSVHAAQKTILQQGIAEEVLRFHVLANSDSEEDQNVKYLVRDEVLAWIEREWNQEELQTAGEIEERAEGPENAEIKETAKGTENAEMKEAAESPEPAELEETEKAAMKEFLSRRLDEIKKAADRVLAEQGMSYRAEAEIVTCYFPDRTYGDCTFPAGWYEALRIRLGEAEGKNWWCVLYPRLCFADSVHAVVEEGQMKQLEEVLTAEEYEELVRKPGEWRIAFRWF